MNNKYLFRFEPEIEPMFITLSLYDFKERKKVLFCFY
jgi:hypothetical protein